MQKMLIADDNKQITSILEEYAKKEGFIAACAYDGVQTLEVFDQFDPDIVLLDVMMPKMDGFEVCRSIRNRSSVPVIMITARGEDFERIMGLDTGADDYIVKPFSPGEVMARVRAIMRRLTRADKKVGLFEYGDLRIDPEEYEVWIGDKGVPLTKKELELLWTLANNKNKVFSRENLLDSIWGQDYFGDSRTVDSHIKRLRSKLDVAAHNSWEIKTIWGVGYKFEVKDV